MSIENVLSALDERDAAIRDRFNAIDQRLAIAELGTRGTPAAAGGAEYKSTTKAASAVRKFLQEGDLGEIKAMAASPDSAGGYLIITEFDREVLRIRDAVSPVSRLCREVSLSSGSAFEIPILRGQMGAAWVTEQGTRDVTDNPDTTLARIEKHECFAMPEVTTKVLDESQYPIDAIVVDDIGHGLARLEADALHTGNGIGKPRGFLSYTVSSSGDSTRTWGEVQYVPSGASGAWHTTKTDPLFDTVFSMKAEYRAGAVWIMNSAALASLSKLKEASTDRPLWQPDLSAATPGRLCGYPIVISENMPSLAANSLSIAFANMREAMTIVRAPGIKLLRDPYSVKGKIRFFAYHRVGAGVVNFDAVKLLRFSAS